MKKEDWIMLLISFAIGIGMMAIPFFMGLEEGVKEVDCFDKHNNKIEGLKCIDENTPEDIWFIHIGFIMMGTFTWAMGFIFADSGGRGL